MAYILPYQDTLKIYDKPKTYKDQATIETVNAGLPYYVTSMKYGFEGLHQPVAGTVSNIGPFGTITDSLWADCTKSRYQLDNTICRCSLADDGIVHQLWTPRLAFLTEESARYYAETGRTIK